MPHGTEPFYNPHSDSYQQPTMIDWDKKANDTHLTGKISKKEMSEAKKYIEIAREEYFQELNLLNARYATFHYPHLVSTEDTKLIWNLDQLKNLKDNFEQLRMTTLHLKRIAEMIK